MNMMDNDSYVVCVKHLKFAPCRVCLKHDMDAMEDWSSDEKDIEVVRSWHATE